VQCCACGGGIRHFNQEFAAGRRKLQYDGTVNAGATTATVLPDGKSFVDFIYRIGAGDSPGLTNVSSLQYID